MKTDSCLQQDVLDELAWESSVDHARVGVAVDNGGVMLSGEVPTFAMRRAAEKEERRAAERTAWSAPGVTKVTDNLVTDVLAYA